MYKLELTQAEIKRLAVSRWIWKHWKLITGIFISWLIMLFVANIFSYFAMIISGYITGIPLLIYLLMKTTRIAKQYIWQVRVDNYKPIVSGVWLGNELEEIE